MFMSNFNSLVESLAKLMEAGSLDVGTDIKRADEFEAYLKKNNIKYKRNKGVFEFTEALEAKAALEKTTEEKTRRISIISGYADAAEKTTNTLTFEALTEALNMTKITAGKLDKKDFPELKDEVFTLSNKSPIIDALIDLLGIPRDGSAYKIRTGFMAYDPKNEVLFFSKNKYDLPAYLKSRPEGWGKSTVKEAIEFNKQATDKEAQRLVKEIGKFFPMDYKMQNDGSALIVINSGSVVPGQDTNPHVANAKNISKAITKDFELFRKNGWTFTQPVGGKFTIGVPA